MRINNLKINSFGKLEDKYLEFKKEQERIVLEEMKL